MAAKPPVRLLPVNITLYVPEYAVGNYHTLLHVYIPEHGGAYMLRCQRCGHNTIAQGLKVCRSCADKDADGRR